MTRFSSNIDMLKKSELSDLEKLSDIQDVAVFVESKVNIKEKCCLWKRLKVSHQVTAGES